MFLDILFVVLGLVLILVGAGWLTDGASAIARRLGLSDLIIGLTVVSFGTSMPEWIISFTASCEGNAPLAVGNVVGSNIFNILAIIGLSALLRPITVGKEVLVTQIPFVILSSAVLLTLCNAGFIDAGGANMITRSDGIILILFFVIFLWHTIHEALKQRSEEEKLGAPAAAQASGETAAPAKEMSALKSWLMLFAGLAMLLFGGNLFVDGASGLAKGLGVSDGVIGLTIAAIGTSLPELATSAAAALKGQNGIAVGNVIGSNVFNIFFVLGSAAAVAPLTLGSIGNFDLLTLMGASLLFWIFGWFFSKRTFNRYEGALMLLLYIAYMTITVVKS